MVYLGEKTAPSVFQAQAHHDSPEPPKQEFQGRAVYVQYTYSRWACATAANNIIHLYSTRAPEEPQWWVEQAFVVSSVSVRTACGWHTTAHVATPKLREAEGRIKLQGGYIDANSNKELPLDPEVSLSYEDATAFNFDIDALRF
ncbi:hypothetical protein EJ02DRAFT_422406 [Clathrospora elynae]|uniref:Uncharacterized protein n=1 Tax=Clathrospora elynae TaxID=706981 RepID=A0A6A5SR28_9PLEO|nr:hypothetical protein EJ02DRAFT_422406 [Clathrospora elynae]